MSSITHFYQLQLQVHKIKANLEYVIVFLTPTILHALKAGREATEMATAAKKLKHKKKAAQVQCILAKLGWLPYGLFFFFLCETRAMIIFLCHCCSLNTVSFYDFFLLI